MQFKPWLQGNLWQDDPIQAAKDAVAKHDVTTIVGNHAAMKDVTSIAKQHGRRGFVAQRIVA